MILIWSYIQSKNWRLFKTIGLQRRESKKAWANVLIAAFAAVDPKSVKRYWQLDWILTLLGATGVKAARKYVGETEHCKLCHVIYLNICTVYCEKNFKEEKKLLSRN